MLWRLAISHAMRGHRYTDDVALCRAMTKKGAIKKFKRLYGYEDALLDHNVLRVRMNHYGVAILTDY